MLTSFTHPEVAPNLYDILKYSMLITKQLLVAIDFHIMETNTNVYYGSQWLPDNVCFPTFFKISSFVFNKRKTLMRFGRLLTGGWAHDDRIVLFGWNIPLRLEESSSSWTEDELLCYLLEKGSETSDRLTFILRSGHYPNSSGHSKKYHTESRYLHLFLHNTYSTPQQSL